MTVQEHVSRDGVRLVYDDLGPRDAPNVVLCHGLAAQAAQFGDDAAMLADRGYRVLVPDLRGHGRSTAPVPLTSASLSIETMAADLAAMLNHAGADRVHWVGNSLGGILALKMLPPGRFNTLTTFATAYRLAVPQVGGHHLVTLANAALGRRAVSALTAWTTTRDPAARALINRMLNNSRPEVTAMLAGVLSRYDLRAEAEAATLPILMLRGGRDTLVNAALEPTLALMRPKPNFRLLELPDGGHCANLDAREPFWAAVFRFWNDA